MRRLVALACTLLFLAQPAWADREEVERAAMSGDMQAQYELGILYEFGYPEHRSDVTALAWYLLAADKGNEKAKTRVDALMKKLSEADIERARQQSRTLESAAPPSAPAQDPLSVAKEPTPAADTPVVPAAPDSTEKPAE